MNYSLFLARRLSLSSGGRKNSPAIKVSVAAVALSMAVMLASVTVVFGFKREIRDKVIGFNSHITVYGMPDQDAENNVLTMTPGLRETLKSESYIEDFSLEASVPAILKTNDDFKGVYLRSAAGNHVRDFISSNLEEGTMPDYDSGNDDNIVISRIAADQLGLKTGDKVDTYFITDQVRVRRLLVAGVFNSHFDSYDQVMIYGSLPLIQKIAGLSASQGTSIQIRTVNFDDIEQNTAVLAQTLDNAFVEGRVFKHYRVDNALSQGAGFFSWLSLLDTNVVVILILMTFVSVATLISGMLILILDKKRFIGVTRAMGASAAGIRRVFVYLALKVGLTGMAIGDAVMLALLFCQDKWHFLPLDPDAYYIDFVPVQISLWPVLILNVACLIIIYCSLILPSRVVSSISPAEAIRSNE